MDLNLTDGSNITLKMLQDTMAKLPVFPEARFDAVLTGWPIDALGIGIPKSVIDSQRILNGILNCQMEIISSPYVPRTRRFQFRFPRSKKKRIRNKWAKQSRNFREESVMWLMNRDAMKLEYPKTKPLYPRYGL